MRAFRTRFSRGGYSLLEVVVSMAILVMSLVILIEIQGTAVDMSTTATHIVTSTQLAQQKLTDVRLVIEAEGVKEKEMTDHGDFDDFGDEQLDLEFGRQLDDYHWEWTVSEVDISMAGDLAGMAEDLAGGGDESDADGGGGGLGLQDNSPDLNSLGVSNEMITEMLSRYIREIRVMVWWATASVRPRSARTS